MWPFKKKYDATATSLIELPVTEEMDTKTSGLVKCGWCGYPSMEHRACFYCGIPVLASKDRFKMNTLPDLEETA